jgi:2'-hydroxyisoflavone reductase
LTDSRDLGRLVVQLIADEKPGAFNAIGPDSTIGELIETSAELAGTSVELVQIPAAPEHFPLMEPAELWGSRRRAQAKARAAGMPVTPLRQTITDMLAWDRDRGEPPIGVGLSPEDEQRLLGQS